MLVIVNPYATTMSDRLKRLVVYALQGRYEVEAIDTAGARPRDRALPRGRARGLRRRGRVRRRRHRQRGRQRPRRLRHAADLPAGRLHQRLRRMLGIPNDVVDATEHLLRARRPLAAAPRRPRRASTAATSRSPPASGSTPAWSSASTRNPRLKARFGAWYFTYVRRSRRSCAATSSTRRGSTVEVDGRDASTASRAFVQNARAVHVLQEPRRSTSPRARARLRRPRRRGARRARGPSTCRRSPAARSPSAAEIGATTAASTRASPASHERCACATRRRPAGAAAGRRRLHRRREPRRRATASSPAARASADVADRWRQAREPASRRSA